MRLAGSGSLPAGFEGHEARDRMDSTDARHRIALLEQRGVVEVAGEDAGKLLQGLLTNDMRRLDEAPAMFAGLLSPQGKILFDFFVYRAGDNFLLETALESAAPLLQRLAFYRLRAKAMLADVSAAHGVLAIWGGPGDPVEPGPGRFVAEDPRLPALGARAVVPRTGEAGRLVNATADDYRAHRIALGVPQGGEDYGYGETFPHEALFDQLHGVDFEKGCYVGQEIVSRMEHRGTARKRIVPIVAATALERGQEVRAGTALLGTVGSVAGQRALALLRLDRAAEAMARGEAIVAGGVPVRIELPDWVTFRIEVKGHAAEA